MRTHHWLTTLSILALAACGRGGMQDGPASESNNHVESSCQTPTTVTTSSGGSVADANGNTWTLTSNGNVQENGSDVAGGGGTSAITAIDGNIYGQDASSQSWYAWTNNQWNGPTSLPQSTCPTTPQIVVITRSSGGQLTDANGNVWTLSASGDVEENGSPVAGGGGTSAITYVNGVIYGQDAASGTWYAWQNGQWNGPQADPTQGTPPPPSQPSQPTQPSHPATGGFHMANGQIIDPNGNVFIARGVDVMEGDQPSVDQLRANFPTLNFVRFAIYTFPDPNSIAGWVNSLTSAGIVVELEDHSSSDGQNRGGGTGTIFSGGILQQELGWYQSVASTFANNPYVWFGTNNEPSEVNPATGQNDPAALSVWQRQTYDAIRNSGNGNPIMLEVTAWSNDQVNVGYDASQYASMTNAIWDMHFYGWLTNYNPDQGTNDTAVSAIAQGAQQIRDADGVLPIIIGEYGNSTTGQDIDANGTQVVAAVLASGYGCVAWAWAVGWPGDGLLNGDGSLSSYGQQVANGYAQ